MLINRMVDSFDIFIHACADINENELHWVSFTMDALLVCAVLEYHSRGQLARSLLIPKMQNVEIKTGNPFMNIFLQDALVV